MDLSKIQCIWQTQFLFSELVLLFIKFMKLSIIHCFYCYLVISWNVSHYEIQSQLNAHHFSNIVPPILSRCDIQKMKDDLKQNRQEKAFYWVSKCDA